MNHLGREHKHSMNSIVVFWFHTKSITLRRFDLYIIIWLKQNRNSSVCSVCIGGVVIDRILLVGYTLYIV